MKIIRRSYILLTLFLPFGFIINELTTIGIKSHNQLLLIMCFVLIIWGFVVFKDELKDKQTSTIKRP